MNLRERLRKLENLKRVRQRPKLQIRLAKQCGDNPDLFEFEGRTMTRDEVCAAVGPGVRVLFICRRDWRDVDEDRTA